MPSPARTLTALACALALAACGDDDNGFTAPEPQVIEEAEFHPDLEVDLSAMTRTASGLYYQDLVVGEGAVAEAGDQATVRVWLYVTSGQLLETEQYTFLIGAAEAIPGFDEGVRGMREGGMRKLVIPPELGYGSQPVGSVPGGSILIFDVEMREVVKPAG
jgi:FKBP-type peptidyl-prolyl cis-trans isomerase FkpA